MKDMYNMGGETADDKRYRMQMQKKRGSYDEGGGAEMSDVDKFIKLNADLDAAQQKYKGNSEALENVARHRRDIENSFSSETRAEAFQKMDAEAETRDEKMEGGEMDDRKAHPLNKGGPPIPKGYKKRKDTGPLTKAEQEVLDTLEEKASVERDEKIKSLLAELKERGGPPLPKGMKYAEGAEPISDEKKAEGGMMKYAEGSMLMPPEMEMEEDMPEDTYDNIPEDEMAAVEASQLPDSEMEEDYTGYVLGQSLDTGEQEYLMSVLETDERLSGIFDKVMDVAGEFAGEGAVEGPGDGTSDSIPARLSDGEFVFTKKATDQMGADQLQTMMDDAERAYDGGYMKKAFGGLTSEDDIKMSSYDSDDEVKKQMVTANRMPSVR